MPTLNTQARHHQYWRKISITSSHTNLHSLECKPHSNCDFLISLQEKYMGIKKNLFILDDDFTSKANSKKAIGSLISLKSLGQLTHWFYKKFYYKYTWSLLEQQHTRCTAEFRALHHKLSNPLPSLGSLLFLQVPQSNTELLLGRRVVMHAHCGKKIQISPTIFSLELLPRQ